MTAAEIREWRQHNNPPPPRDEIGGNANAKIVTIVHGGDAWLIEDWVRLAEAYCSERMDWYYVGGRGVIVTIDDAAACLSALRATRILMFPHQ